MKSIFLADGEKHVRDALRLLLENQTGFVVVGEASTAESLLAQVCQQLPDAILLDWNLPGFHPQRLLAALRQCCPGTRILATSVKPEQGKIAYELNVDAFLSKHLDPDLFIESLVSALDHPRNRGSY